MAGDEHLDERLSDNELAGMVRQAVHTAYVVAAQVRADPRHDALDAVVTALADEAEKLQGGDEDARGWIRWLCTVLSELTDELAQRKGQR